VPEQPPQHLQVLGAAEFRRVDFIRVFDEVLAAHAYSAVGLAVQVTDAQGSLVQQGVRLAIDEGVEAQVDGHGRIDLQAVDHAVVGHDQRGGLGEIHTQFFKRCAWQAQVQAFERHQPTVHGLVEGNKQIVGLADGQVCGGADRSGPFARCCECVLCRVVVRAEEMHGVGVFGPLAGPQPTCADAEQFGNFVEARSGDAAVKPVVDVLRGQIAMRREVCGAQVAFVKEVFESVAGCIHGLNFTTDGFRSK
jgi:hypothetical protein